jgi:peptidoglycan L-alanyl-D-glutamate endopeptidase CwlK
MPAYSKKSIERLSQAHEDLVTLANEVIKYFDCTCTTGYRNKEDQNKAFKDGYSDKKYPESKHNKIPSEAIDLVPYEGKLDYNELQCYYFSGIVKMIAIKLYEEGKITHKIRSGSDWDMDNDVNDQKLKDPCHFEIITKDSRSDKNIFEERQ